MEYQARLYGVFKIMTMLVVICFMSGCIPYHKIVKGEFPQGEKTNIPYRILSRNLQDSRLYDGFSSQLEVNALWFSDEMREWYSRIFSRRRGKDRVFEQAFLQREWKENKYSITFYLLAYAPNQEQVALQEPNPYWTLYLELPNGHHLTPSSIKEIDFSPEIRAFFGDKYNPFKRSFVVTFAYENFPFSLGKNDDTMTLVMKSISYTTYLRWRITPFSSRSDQKLNKQESRYEDFYWV